MKRILSENGQGYFKPWATSTPVLLLLLFFTSILIVLAELACRSIPEHSGYGQYKDGGNTTLRRDLTDTRNEVPPVPPARSSSLLASVPNQTPTSSAQIYVQSSGIPLHTGSLYSSPTASGFPSRFSISNQPNSDVAAPTPATRLFTVSLSEHPGIFNYLSTQGASATTIHLQISDYLSLAKSTTESPELVTVGSPISSGASSYLSATVPLVTSPVLLGTASFPTGNASPGRITLDPILVVDTGGQTLAYTPITSPAGATSASAPIALTNAKFPTENISQVLTVINGRTYSTFPTPILTVIYGQTFTEVAGAIPTSSNTILLEITKTAVVPVSTIVNVTGTFFKWSNGQSTISAQISLQQYILVSFVPLILATLYTIPWKILDNTIREMEPFYQLSQHGGATAENSICLDYATSSIFTVPVKAISRGQMLVFCSSLISLTVMFLPSLASEAMFVSMTGACAPSDRNDTCYSAWAVYPKLIRIIQALLSFIAILVIFMIAYSYRRPSKIYSEPLSIVGLASLLSNSPALESFQRIDSKTKQKELKILLAGKRFAILELSEMGQSPCSVILELQSNHPSTTANKWLPFGKTEFESSKISQITLPSDFDRSADDEGAKPKGRLSLFWQDFKTKFHFYLAMLFLCVVFILIAFYFFTVGNSGFEHWMDSETYGLRFAWTGLGTAIKLFWSNLDQDLRRNEPYHRLLMGSVQPEDSLLVPVYMSPFSAILPSLRRRHFLVSVVCFASVLAEFLPICLGNIPYSTSLTFRAYVTCSILTMTILLFMMACIMVLILRPRKRVKPLPRKTDTLASVFCYIATTPGREGDAMGMLGKMRGLSKMGTSERNNFVTKGRGLYAMGVGEGGVLKVDCDERIKKLWLD